MSFKTIVSLFLVTSQLPPVDAAISITTEPGFMASTVAFLKSKGAFLPGICAVQITTSDFMASDAIGCSELTDLGMPEYSVAAAEIYQKKIHPETSKEQRTNFYGQIRSNLPSRFKI